MPVLVSREQIKKDLRDGYTRLKSDANYNPEIGSIEEKYEIDPEVVKIIFQHPELKHKKTHRKKAIVQFVEDIQESEVQAGGYIEEQNNIDPVEDALVFGNEVSGDVSNDVNYTTSETSTAISNDHFYIDMNTVNPVSESIMPDNSSDPEEATEIETISEVDDDFEF